MTNSRALLIGRSLESYADTCDAAVLQNPGVWASIRMLCAINQVAHALAISNGAMRPTGIVKT